MPTIPQSTSPTSSNRASSGDQRQQTTAAPQADPQAAIRTKFLKALEISKGIFENFFAHNQDNFAACLKDDFDSFYKDIKSKQPQKISDGDIEHFRDNIIGPHSDRLRDCTLSSAQVLKPEETTKILDLLPKEPSESSLSMFCCIKETIKYILKNLWHIMKGSYE